MASFNNRPRKAIGSTNGGGKQFIVSEPRCHVCTSPHRKTMEEWLLAGMSYSRIAEFFQEAGETVTRKNLSNHYERHMNVTDAAIRHIIEERAKDIALNVDEAKGILLTKHALLDIMVQKGFESIMAGNTTVEPETLIKLVERMDRLEQEKGRVQVDQMMVEWDCFHSAVKQFVPPKMWAEIMQTYQDKREARMNPITLEERYQLEGPTK